MDDPALVDEECDPELSQWFTDPSIARRVVEWTRKHHPNAKNFLEPNAGRGAIVREIVAAFPEATIDAIEFDPRFVRELRGISRRVEVFNFDFLLINSEYTKFAGRYDGTIMNPPFEGNADARHVKRACEISDFVVAILRSSIFHGIARWWLLWRWVDIKRSAVFVRRPTFGGAFTPKLDYVVVEVAIRKAPRELGEPSDPYTIEWW